MAGSVRQGYLAKSGKSIRGGFFSAALLTLTDVAKDQITFQRGLENYYDVPASGTYSGICDFVEGRAVDFFTGDAITPWMVVDAAPSGGNYAGFVRVNAGLGWYRLQTRDGRNTASVLSGSNRFGVGEVFLDGGQSNMFNFQSTAEGLYPTGSKYVTQLTTGNLFKRIGNIKDTVPTNSLYPAAYTTFTNEGDRADGHTYFANLMSALLGMNVCIINRAQSGSKMSQWKTGGAFWTNFVNAVALTGGAAGASWHLGETDADLMSTSTMVSELGVIQGQFHALTGRNSSTFKFGVISLGPGPFGSSSEGEFGNMRAAILQFARTSPGAFLMTCAHDSATVLADRVHIDGAGHSRNGRRKFRSMAYQYGNGVSGAGPRINTVTRAAAKLSLNIVHAGGTALTDGLGGTGTSLSGYQCLDQGNSNAVINVVSSQIVSPTLIELNLATTPVGPVTFSYAMMDVPHGVVSGTHNTFIPETCVYDNVPILNSSVGCPLQPLAPITVS